MEFNSLMLREPKMNDYMGEIPYLSIRVAEPFTAGNATCDSLWVMVPTVATCVQWENIDIVRLGTVVVRAIWFHLLEDTE